MEQREIYKNAPVVLVALEIKHPTAEPLSRTALAGIKRALTEHTPIQREASMVEFGAPEIRQQTVPKFFSRDRRSAVTFWNGSVVVETTDYTHYEKLRSMAKLAFEVAREFRVIDGLDRIGLRYIDEIRVPEMELHASPTAWAPWINQDLLGLGPVGDSLGFKATQLQSFVSFDVADDYTLALRLGMAEGYAVSPDGDLKRRTPPPGPFFLLDIDSYWMPGERTPEPEVEEVISICNRLHEPVRRLFEGIITDKLRNEVLRNGR